MRPIPLPDQSGDPNGTEKEVVVDLGEDNVDEVGDVVDALGRSTIDKRRTELRLPRTLETTLFDRLERIYGPGIKRLLSVQYRWVLDIQGGKTGVLRLLVSKYERDDIRLSFRRLVQFPVGQP